MQIKFLDVSYTYKTLDNKNTTALKDITLDLSENTTTAIVGHTGSGKSTAMQHINGLLQPTTGEIQVEDLIITAKKNRKMALIRKHIGYVFQNPQYQLFANTVLEDVMYGPLNFGYSKEEAQKLAEEALELVGIEQELFERYPFDLSGGQMRKVAIAGAIAYQPDVLILDEPTVGLDPLATRQITELFQKLHVEHKKALIFITHDMEFVQEFAQRVVVFEKGTIVFDGPVFDLFIDNHRVENYSLEMPSLYQLVHGIKKVDPSFYVEQEDCQSSETLIDKIEQWKGARK